MITPWMRDPPRSAYFAYDANLGIVTPSDRLSRRRGKPCPHYPANAVGDPMFDVRRYLERSEKPEILKASPQPSRTRASWIDQFWGRIRSMFR